MKFILLMLLLGPIMATAQTQRGADIPWTTYEAENMQTNGLVLGPTYAPYLVTTESSGQRCVQLARGKYVRFAAQENANTLLIRYSLPDAPKGGGISSRLAVYKNDKLLQHCDISSHYTMLYGHYPFSNNPDSGRARNFYDEVHLQNIVIKKGDVLRIQPDTTCIIDLVDLEQIPPPRAAPANALSLADFRDSSGDYTTALRQCITRAASSGKTVWLPAGQYKITGDIELPANVTIQGAGMWYTTLVGDEKLYRHEKKRVHLKGNGSNIHLADFAIVGALDYRSDREDNDGIGGSFGTGSTIARLWITHTKVGMWIENSSHLEIEGCRMRNTIADGINFCVGMFQSIMKNCTARGGGDDCFAIWPAAFRNQQFSPGHNLIINCTGQLPFLANGACIYGGESNAIKNCTFSDISPGCAILISNTFPTSNKTINNNFSGITLVENCGIKTSGGFDHTWDWRGAIEICVDRRDIAGLELRNIDIENSFSNGLQVRDSGRIGVLSGAALENVRIGKSGLGAKDSYGLYISPGAKGSLKIDNAQISSQENVSSDFKLIP